MVRWIPLIGLFALFAVLSSCGRPPKKEGAIFQVSPISALLAGCFDGRVDFTELKKHGDFGIGALDGVDGELIGLDGRFLQIKGDGRVLPVPDTMTTPYAIVTFFKPVRTAEIGHLESYAGLEAFLDGLIETMNIFYAVRIDGEFARLKARSIPRQNKPYRPLVEVVKDQSVFEFSGVRGTLVGFRCPPYLAGLNFPGYHFHFLDRDGKAGGHVMELEIVKATAGLAPGHAYSLAFPGGDDFYGMDLSKDRQDELRKVQSRSGSE